MMPAAIHWANPEFVWALYGWLAILVVLVLLERRGSDALDRLVGSALQSQLVVRPARWRRVLRLVLLAIAGVAMALALMRPQMGERFVATPRVGAEIMVALDVSRSMLADDAKPSRLERAKAEIRDLLGYLGDDHVGLIAFAGRASVLSPMTPDKSFLRLALDGAGPHSVPRGGTKVAEAIRRAVVGFGEPGPAQRALILITDGEDHDSFALDAAKQAAEAGIKIIAIGFGDENGSAIYVRDPKTGARSRVVDGDGRPVISRLNGDLLRSLALETDGAFVPAGTGVLDLASIYDAHISKLTRGQMDERGRTIRDEAYGLFLAVAFVCLIGAVFLIGGSANPTRGVRAETLADKSATLLLVGAVFVGLIVAPIAEAQTAPDLAHPDAPLESPLPEEEGETSAASVEVRPVDPRERFNAANAALAEGSDEVASVQLRDARRDATGDPELRYAATYNLGMAAMARADRLQGERPKEALEALHNAADWFREAVGMRPETKAPRHNLEVALRRATMLADELAQKEQGDLEATLDKLVEDQRARVAVVAELLSAVARAGELDAVDRMRPAFEAAATEQRILLSQADELADRVVRDREAIQAMPEETRSPEDTLRGFQLEGVLIYLDGAIERMGSTRRQLRQRQAERAYRRGASAMGELKRARDQLRDPVEQIGVLLDETRGLAGVTAALLQSEGSEGGGAARPAFLTSASVEADVHRLEQRVAELAARLTTASEQVSAAQAKPANPNPAAQGPDPAEQEALRDALIGAAPLVADAATHLEAAAASVGSGQTRAALQSEAAAGQGLADAQELFFDLTQLLEVAVGDQRRIVEIATSDAEAIASAREEYAPLARDIERKNLGRVARLSELLDREREERLAAAEAAVAQAAESGAAPAVGPDGEALPDAVAIETERFIVADQLLALGEGAMREVDEALGETAVEWAGVGEAADRSRARLEDLETLFFSLIEHLQKLARDQVDVSDETKDAIALAAADVSGAKIDETRAQAVSIGQRQKELEARAGGIADALLEQSSAPQKGAASEEQAAKAQEDLRKAAELVANAQLEMGAAGSILAGEAGPLPTAEPPQKQAIEDLAAALALLTPPPPPDEDSPEQQDQQEQEQESGEEGSEEDSSDGQSDGQSEGQEQEEAPEEGDGEAEASETPEAEESGEDPSQLLQGVRDREAERRRERERDQQRRRSRPVDKDW